MQMKAQIVEFGLCFDGHALVSFTPFALDAHLMRGIAFAGFFGLLWAPGHPTRSCFGDANHGDAIDGACGHTQLTTRAKLVDHRVHELGRADDAVDWAGFDAKRATDAPSFVDDGQGSGAFGTVCDVKR